MSTYLIFLDQITQITFGEEHKSCSSSLCSSFQSQAVSYLLVSNTIHSKPPPQTLSGYILSFMSDKAPHSIEQAAKL